MISFDKIKLVIWDLDDTFWSGTLTEGGATPIPENINLVKNLTDCGIINTICSKNDAEPVLGKLKEFGIADYFVFCSIDWTPKGQRIATLLTVMGLRPVNVLFLDDNPVNLNEAEYYSKGLMTGTPEDIPSLIEWVYKQAPSDKEHKRLNQYKILHNKQESKKAFSSNEEFLYNTHTKVDFFYDCQDKIDRIHELILRTNQLNFTKLRSTKEELKRILNDDRYECAYVNVRDDFGDYGTIGFYALDKSSNSLLHFLFSCRTIGQGVEQYVYAKLGHPKLEVIGEVINFVTDESAPLWINQDTSEVKTSCTTQSIGGRILIKGPCDLESAVNYFNSSGIIDTEFTYVKEGTNNRFFAHNHSAHILDLLLSNKEKQEMLNDCPFVDPEMMGGKFFSGEYDWIILSTFLESHYCVYHKRSNPMIKVVLDGADKSIQEECNWEHFKREHAFSMAYIRHFNSEYEYEGYTTPEKYISFLDCVLKELPLKTRICLILGATKLFDDEVSIKRHSLLNDAIIQYSRKEPRVRFVKIDDCIESRSDFTNQINHFKRIVYYRLAQQIIQCVGRDSGLKSASRTKVFIDSFVWKVSRQLSEGFVKRFLRKIYRCFLRK